LTESYNYLYPLGVAGGDIEAQEDDLGPIERALEQLFRLNASRKVLNRRAAAAGVVISQPGFQLLRRIQEDEGVQIGELARLTDMDPAATGRQVAQLEEDGLVTREKASDDRRAVIVRVTPRGAEVRRSLGVVSERHMSDVLSGWSADDRMRLAQLLPRLVEGLRTVAYRPDVAADPAGQVRSA
jgi:DNA-binding MarR family transcriptional regulator